MMKGLTAKALLRHLKCTQPSLSEQMKLLAEVGLGAGLCDG